MKRLPALFAALGLAAAFLAYFAAPELSDPGPEIRTWPGGLVPFRFDPGVEPVFRELILSAMREWEERAGAVSFSEVPAPPLAALARALGRDRSLLIRQDPRLPAFARTTIGAGPGRSLVFNPAMDESSWIRADFLHELGHVLGLTHEHQRQDRDLHVRIPEEFWQRAGARAADYRAGDYGPFPPGAFPYDYASIMHYGSNIDGNMMTRVDTGALIPSASSPSALDVEKLRLLYGR